jgi:hypothetical protein
MLDLPLQLMPTLVTHVQDEPARVGLPGLPCTRKHQDEGVLVAMTNERAMELQKWSEWCEYHRHDEYMSFRNGSTIRFARHYVEGGEDDGDDSSEGQED